MDFTESQNRYITDTTTSTTNRRYTTHSCGAVPNVLSPRNPWLGRDNMDKNWNIIKTFLSGEDDIEEDLSDKPHHRLRKTAYKMDMMMLLSLS